MIDIQSYSKHAHLAARVIQQVMMNNLGLMPPTEYTLTTHNGNVWLVAAMDTLALNGRLEAYENPNVAHQLSTALSAAFGAKQAIPVITANHTGLRYCMLFGKKPSLPKRVDFPGFADRDIFRLGVGLRGEVSLQARLMKNVIIGAAQEQGKSNILRLIAHQARSFGWSLYLADSQAHTFNPDVWNGISAHPVAGTVDELLKLLASLKGALEDRSAQFRAAANGGIPPADLDAYNLIATPMPRILFAIDEASTPLQDKRVFLEMAALLREGRKWGLHIIMAGHEWHKDVIPAAVNDMLQTRIALPMIDEGSGYVVTRSHTWGKWVIGKSAGRGVLRTNQYTPMQFYLVTPEMEAEWLASNAPAVSPLPEDEMEIVVRSLSDANGKMTIPLLKGWGVDEWKARTLLEKYELRGWLAKNPQQGNARCVTPKLADLLSNHQTPQSPSNPQIWSQTLLKPSQTLNMEGATA
jgi:hypothetical protein